MYGINYTFYMYRSCYVLNDISHQTVSTVFKMDSTLFSFKILSKLVLILLFVEYGKAKMSAQEIREYLVKFNYIGEKLPDIALRKLYRSNDVSAIRLGLMMFQAKNGLKVTGFYDPETEALMSAPRCALADINRIEDMPTITVNNRLIYIPPTKTADLTPPKKTDLTIAEFSTGGSPWRRNALTYRIVDYTSDLAREVARSEIIRALDAWAEVTPLTFIEVTDTADIEFRFGAGDHGDGFDFDGRSGTLAHAFLPNNEANALEGDCHFDDDESWTAFTRATSNGQVDLFQVALHEIGHSLGLLHSDVAGSIMYPIYTGYDSETRLHPDDIEGIQSLYGENPNAPNPAPTTTERTIRTTPTTTTTTAPTTTPRTTTTPTTTTTTPTTTTPKPTTTATPTTTRSTTITRPTTTTAPSTTTTTPTAPAVRPTTTATPTTTTLITTTARTRPVVPTSRRTPRTPSPNTLSPFTTRRQATGRTNGGPTTTQAAAARPSTSAVVTVATTVTSVASTVSPDTMSATTTRSNIPTFTTLSSAARMTTAPTTETIMSTTTPAIATTTTTETATTTTPTPTSTTPEATSIITTPTPSMPAAVAPTFAELCSQSNTNVDAFTAHMDNGVLSHYLFKEEWCMKYSMEGFREQEPVHIQDIWTGLPTNINAAIYLPQDGNLPSLTLFVKGSKYYIFEENFKSVENFAGDLSDMGLPVSNVDTIFQRNRNGIVRFYASRENSVFELERIDNNMMPLRVRDGTSETSLTSMGIDVGSMEAAFLAPINDKTYFFKDGNYWGLHPRLNRYERARPRYPRSIETFWFGC